MARSVIALLVFVLAAHAADLVPGQLLIATPASRDPDFARSVVLLIHYDRRGAVGIMLNRASRIAVSDLLPGAKGVSGFAWAGGPVPMGVIAIVESRKPPDPAVRLFGDVYAVTDRPTVSDIVQSHGKVRIFAGNCGWTVEQIASEIHRGLWRVRPATAALVFDSDPSTLWDRMQ
jgi:putative transcriptional regulator